MYVYQGKHQTSTVNGNKYNVFTAKIIIFYLQLAVM